MEKTFEKTFSMEDQMWFAALAGDHNPVHLDPERARRSQFGSCIVHGMHLVTWVIEKSLLSSVVERNARLIKASGIFMRPVAIDTLVQARVAGAVTKSGLMHLEATISIAGVPHARFRFDFTHAGNAGGIVLQLESVFRSDLTPRDRTLSDLDGHQGIAELVVPEDMHFDDNPLFEQSHRFATAILVCLSRIVGVHSPGLYSIFSAFDISLANQQNEGQQSNADLKYKVTMVDQRFSLVKMVVSGPAAGTLKAFVRPRPVVIPPVKAIETSLDNMALRGRQVLVIGGSQGLGQATVKILAKAGADVVFTYHGSAAESRALMAELAPLPGRIVSFKFDVTGTSSLADQLAANSFCPDSLYYFATPRIFGKVSKSFSNVIFDRFAAVYIDGFARVIEAVKLVQKGPLTVFYPSSAAIDEPIAELLEYAVAKAASETLCRQLPGLHRDLSIVCERLPRIATDQTLSVLNVRVVDPLKFMLGAVSRTERLDL